MILDNEDKQGVAYNLLFNEINTYANIKLKVKGTCCNPQQELQ